MRRLTLAAVAIFAASCETVEPVALTVEVDGEDHGPAFERWASDPAVRRSALEASLVSRENAYARLRLDQYDETRWGALGELDVETTPITVEDAVRGEPAPSAVWATTDHAGVGWNESELHGLGQYAFYNYTAQVMRTLPTALASPDHGGNWVTDERTGAVWARMLGGTVPAATCATCHAVREGDQVVVGKNNADLDGARLVGDGHRGPGWGPGRIDVTADSIDDPIAITDLRPVRWQKRLHHAGTLVNDPVALAIRIETLLITNHGQAVRPPRKVVAGLAVFLLHLVSSRESVDPSGRGAEVFARACAGCHEGEGASGEGTPVEVVGTDPLVGRSPERGTGSYRIPSLRRVAGRRRLFASGAVADVEDLLTDSAVRRAKGHTFGLDLSADDRAALLEYLGRL